LINFIIVNIVKLTKGGKMSKSSEDFIKEIEQKIKKAVGGEPGQDQGLFINEDNQDWGSSGLEHYTAAQRMN
jgi:hypothetical protein